MKKSLIIFLAIVIATVQHLAAQTLIPIGAEAPERVINAEGRKLCWASAIQMQLLYFGIKATQRELSILVFEEYVDSTASASEMKEAIESVSKGRLEANIEYQVDALQFMKHLSQNGPIITGLKVGQKRKGHAMLLFQVECLPPNGTNELVPKYALLADPRQREPQIIKMPWAEFEERFFTAILVAEKAYREHNLN